MIPAVLFAGVLLVAGLTVAGVRTGKRMLYALAVVAALLCAGYLLLFLLVNSPLWPM